MKADAPSWIRAATVLGVPSVIALGLVYWLTQVQSATLAILIEKVDHHEMMRQQDMQQMNSFLYAICLNTADGDTARARCAVALDGALRDLGRKP
jgi:hypothetical protein